MTQQNRARQQASQRALGGALAGVRVVDLTDERAIYGAKLLADLGADVVRFEPPGGDPLRRRGPHHEAAGAGCTSLWYAFFASNRRLFEVDPASEQGRTQLWGLLEQADVVLSTDHAFASDLLREFTPQLPHLVVVDTSSFGRSGPWRNYLAPDLVAGALGGVLATTGDEDTPPLKPFGELNFMVAGAYAAIAALSALFERRRSGEGQTVDVSVHECLVSCLEQVLMFYWYGEAMGREEGRVLPRRGALHWSNAYDVLNGINGSIMVTPAPDFDAQLAWLIEEGVHDDLIEPKYSEPENLPLRIKRSMEILRKWVATKDVEALFYEAQARHAPYGWVLPIDKVADNPQLAARKWFVDYEIGDATVTATGAPYRFSETQTPLGAHTAAQVLGDIGWESADE